MKWKRRLLALLASTALSLLLLETGLRLFTPFPRADHRPNCVPDPRLDYRMDPALDEIDPAGFRNPAVPDHVDLVTIGDSHTYGYNVPSDQSWPAQLGRMLDLSVYNLGLGGYGLLQSYALIDDALALKPREIVIGLYPRNDVIDMCGPFQSRYWKNFATERGLLVNPAIRDCVRAGDRQRQLQTRWSWKKTAIGSFLYFHLIQELQFRRMAQSDHAGEAVVIDDAHNQTAIPLKRIISQNPHVDLGREQIRDLFALAKTLFAEMKKRADSNRVRLSVLIIPSKENVFNDYLLERGQDPPEPFRVLVKNERLLTAAFEQLLDDLEIPHVQALPYVQKKLEDPGRLYQTQADNHPDQNGYQAYAEAARDGLFPNLAAGTVVDRQDQNQK